MRRRDSHDGPPSLRSKSPDIIDSVIESPSAISSPSSVSFAPSYSRRRTNRVIDRSSTTSTRRQDSRNEPKLLSESPECIELDSVSTHGQQPPRRFSRRRPTRLSVDFLDPQGVHHFARSLTSSSRSETLVGDEFGDLVETLEGSSESFDCEKDLRRFLRHWDNAGNKERREGVVFEGLRVVGAGSPWTFQSTLASTLDPINIAKGIRSLYRPPLQDILIDFNGVIRSGEMLLVLGRPKSGCSSFIKALANLRYQYHSIEGKVYYGNLTPEELATYNRGDVQYFPETDLHLPTITVKQTINFAAKTRSRAEHICGMDKNQYMHLLTDIYITMLGLNNVKESAVQDLDPGEKKRLSICEMLITRCRMGCWDNSTTRLDSRATLQFAQALRMATDLAGIASVVSAYQGRELLYELFNKVCLIYEGRLVYYGQADKARKHFFDMGYYPLHPRQTTPDFLVSITDPHRQQFYLGKSTGFVPRTAKEFEAYYKASEAGKANIAEIASYKEANVDPGKKVHRTTRERLWDESYTISSPMQFKEVYVRHMLLMKSISAYEAFTCIACLVEGAFLGVNFDSLPDTTSSYFTRAGLIFLSLTLPTLVIIEEVPYIFGHRPIVLRHYRAAMYRPGIQGFAWTMTDLPFTVLENLWFLVPLYFIALLPVNANHFFTYFAFVFMLVVCLKAGARVIAVFFTNLTLAREMTRHLLLALSLYVGFEIQIPSMVGALRWLTWINPYRYAFGGIAISQFRGLKGFCTSIIPSGPGYEDVSPDNQVCGVPGSVTGQLTVRGEDYLASVFHFNVENVWRDFGVLCAFSVALFVCFLLVAEYRTNAPPGISSPVLFKRRSRAFSRMQTALSFQDAEEPRELRTAENALDEHNSLFDLNPRLGASTSHLASKINVLSWRKISYGSAPGLSGEDRQFFLGISGYIAPGQLVACFGRSDGRASTLLNILAGRMGSGTISGERFLDGHPLPSDFQHQVGFCQKENAHASKTTVREALQFSSRLRQPKSVSIEDKDAYADECLRMSGLETLADAIVGSLSVEELRRVSIAVELAAKPPLLFFADKPTSGLDSAGAWATMLFLRKLANSGQAILCTVDEPSAEILQLFDRVLVLKDGGESVYFGEVGKNASTLIQYFETNGSRRCSADENPADFVLDVVNSQPPANSGDDWRKIWIKSQGFERLQSEIEQIHARGNTSSPVAPLFHSRFALSWFEQVMYLFQRQMRTTWRDPVYLLAKMELHALFGTVLGLTFLKPNHTIRGTREKIFSIFAGTFLSFPIGPQLHPTFIQMRSVYENRERESGMYHWTAFITAHLLSEIPWNFFCAALFFFPWYFLMGFPISQWGYVYLQFGIIFPLYYTTLALASAAASPNIIVAGRIYTGLFAIVLAFDDVVQPFYDFGWMIWLYYITPYTYLTDACFAAVASHQPIRCGDDEFVVLNPPSGSTCASYLARYMTDVEGYVTNPDATSACNFCPYRSTDEFLYRNYNTQYKIRWMYVGIFLGHVAFNVCVHLDTLALYLLAYLRIRYTTRSSTLKEKMLVIVNKLRRMPESQS